MGDRLCDTELTLRLGSSVTTDHSTSSDSNTRSCSSHVTMAEQKQQQKNKTMTIVYGSQVCACDVTEIQARFIINLAQKMEKAQSMKLNNSNKTMINSQSASPSPSPPPTPAPQFQCPRLSMKRSLQRFLEKRNTRIDGASPYSVMEHRVPIFHC